MTRVDRMPAVFIGHGSPMNALEHNRFTEAWTTFGASIPRPRAIVAVSAHWYINATAVTAMESPRVIHDFYGFPQALFDVDYPVPGSPAVADEVIEALSPHWVGRDVDSWGIDHGTWSVLAHMFPDASVPVVQLSLDATKSFSDHFQLGACLARLRDSGILVLASGNVVHNLGRIAWGRRDFGEDWAVEFDGAVRHIMTSDPAALCDVEAHSCFDLAVPTPDHFLPLLYLAGMADRQGTSAEVLVGGCELGSLSMASFVLR